MGFEPTGLVTLGAGRVSVTRLGLGTRRRAEVLLLVWRPATGSQPPGRSGQAFPEPAVVQPLEQQHLSLRSLDRNPRRNDARVVDHDECVADHVR